MKVILFLADGFEEVEALTTVDYLRRKNIEVDTVSITKEKEVTGSHGIIVLADKILAELRDKDSYGGLIIPGGLPGATNLRDDDEVIALVREFAQEGKLTAAICAGPIVLAKAGVITGKDITSYPGFAKDLQAGNYLEEKVVVDGEVITARGPAIAGDFALAIITYFLGEEKAEELKQDILYYMA